MNIELNCKVSNAHSTLYRNYISLLFQENLVLWLEDCLKLRGALLVEDHITHFVPGVALGEELLEELEGSELLGLGLACV